MPSTCRIGLISDTHGLLRPAALDFLRGADHIVHGGDIGGPDILETLAALAPLTAVRGNNDREPWAAALPLQVDLEFGGVKIHVLHDIADLPAPAPAVRVVVAGHSHKPRVQEQGGILYVNPGSAGRRRFSLPIALGELCIRNGEVTARIVELAP